MRHRTTVGGDENQATIAQRGSHKNGSKAKLADTRRRRVLSRESAVGADNKDATVSRNDRRMRHRTAVGGDENHGRIAQRGSHKNGSKVKLADNRRRRVLSRESAVVANKKDATVISLPPRRELDVFVSCLPGLERILSQELRALNIDHEQSVGGVSLLGPTTVHDVLNCHLYLGTASNVLLRCGKPFSARGMAELRRKTARMPWTDILQRNIRLDARVSSTKSKLYHTAAIQERILAGIYEALGYDIPSESPGAMQVPDGVGEDAPLVRLDIQVVRDMVEIFINTSPTPLHQRGYRLQTAKAPLREDVAHAMLWSSGWRPHYPHIQQLQHQATPRRYEALLDPFCGSGTIAIEAAAIMVGLPPGRLRPAPLVGTRLENQKIWSSLQQTSLSSSEQENSPSVCIAASDRDAGAVEATKANAMRAGLHEFLDVQHCAVSSHPWLEDAAGSPQKLLIATNPPFGNRISPSRGEATRGKHGGLVPLYQTLGHRIHRLVGSRHEVGAVILTNSPEIVRRTTLPFEFLFRSTHGGLSVSAMYYNVVPMHKTSQPASAFPERRSAKIVPAQ